MPNTQGFETVVEAGPDVLRKVLRAAWKSAECPDEPGDESRIPEFIDIPPPDVEFGGYRVADGQIQIPESGLDARLAAGIGTELEFGLEIQFEIEDPPVPSARLFDMSAELSAIAPIDTGPDGRQVFVFLDRINRSDVSTSLTSGHPLEPKLDQILKEFVHAAYENDGVDPTLPSIPHVIEEFDVTWSFGVGAVTLDVYAEIYSDEANPAHRIEVSRPNPTTLEISLPIYLRMYNIRKTGAAAFLDIRSPMGIETRLILRAPFDTLPGRYVARISEAVVTTGPISPSPISEEAANYLHNKSAIPLVNLDDLIEAELVKNGEELAANFGDFSFDVPTLAQIEAAISDIFYAELTSRGTMPVWTPADSEEFTINDVTVRVRNDALIIAINQSPGANVAGIAGFIPAGREFAIAIDGAKVNELVAQARADEGLADSDLPARMEADGKDVDLNSLNVALTNGALRITGEVTVIDAILGSIDVDASFRSDIGLHWEPNASLNAAGVQALKHHTIGEPDIDTDIGWLLFLILVLLGFATGGLLGALIGVIIALIITAIASSIGSSVASDAISGLPIGMGAWPSELSRVGTVRAVFHDPVLIEVDGILLAGTLDVISSCEDTAIVPAHSGSAYSGSAASAMALVAGNTHPDASYRWQPGDGSGTVLIQNLTHVYVASGLYLAKHSVIVNQAGGATSRHFAQVNVKNIQPVVDAGSDIVVNEGEVVTLVGHFWDDEYPDTHESVWDFGDDQQPKPGVINETNLPPRAVGTSTVQHAWCDNGVYTVTLRVRDQNGGMGIDTRRVTVLNVDPVVDAGSDRFAYPCMPITLRAGFTDDGWCDTHTGTWDFGDCSPLQTAIIRETNEPPAAVGVAAAAHIYHNCGSYRAVATVTDDDGGVGSDETTIRVVEIRNADFEGGFRPLAVGDVANHWEPYFASKTNMAASAVAMSAAAATYPDLSRHLYLCEQCVVHGGQRSQRLLVPSGVRVGIYQKLGANPGWCYQVSGFYAFREGFGGTARLGIDPEGGSDPGAASIVWSVDTRTGGWTQLAEIVVAQGDAVTIFFEATAYEERGVAEVFFDNVEFVATEPCCEPECDDEPEPEPERPEEPPIERCMRFERRPPEPRYIIEGVVFEHLSGQPVTLITYGPPPGELKLYISPGGLQATLPIVASWVRASIAYGGGKPPEMTAYDAAGTVIGHAVGNTSQSSLQVLRIDASGIKRVVLTGQETGLYQLCYGTGVRRRASDSVEIVTGRDLETVVSHLPIPTRYRTAHQEPERESERPATMLPRPAHIDIPLKAWEKFDPDLQRRARQRSTSAAEMVDVMIELTRDAAPKMGEEPGAPRARQQSVEFERETNDIRALLHEHGADDLKPLWIGRAIACRIPLRGAIAAAGRDDVVRVRLVLDKPALL